MEPSDFSDADDAASAMAGILWSMYRRLRAEGANTMEAAIITGSYFGAMGGYQTGDDEDKEKDGDGNGEETID